MIHLILSTKCEDHLDLIADAYEEVTGQIFNAAEFVEKWLLALDPDLIEEAFAEVFDV